MQVPRIRSFDFALVYDHTMKKSDENLITWIKEGGRSRERAAAFMIKQYVGFVHKQKRVLPLSEDEVLDCFVDAVTDVIENISADIFKGRSSIGTYLYQICYFRCVDLSRKNSKNVALEEFEDKEDFSQNISRNLETEYEIREVSKYMNELGDKCRAILMDWGFWGYSMKEIAKRNELKSESIAKSRKYQCLGQLRKLMGIYPK